MTLMASLKIGKRVVVLGGGTGVISACDVVIAAEGHHSRSLGDDLDGHGTRRRTTAVEEIPCVIGTVRGLPPACPHDAAGCPAVAACPHYHPRSWESSVNGL